MTTPKATKDTKTTRLPKTIGLLWALVFGVFLCEALIYTWCRMQCVQVGYAIADETRRQQEYKTLNNSLKIELTHLKAPENISRIAQSRLALGMPDPKQIIVLP
jgi:hypothetical protein